MGKERIPFGKGVVEVDLEATVVDAKDASGVDPEKCIGDAIDNPIGCGGLGEIVSEKSRVCVVVNDRMRLQPIRSVLEQLLPRLEKQGVRRENILVVFALGSHRKQSRPEWEALVGKNLLDTYRFVDHEARDGKQLVSLGETERGTPVEVFRKVCESDKVFLTGNAAFHYFAGYSGGRKSVLPGVSSVESIRRNHSLVFSGGCESGKLAGNAVSEDMFEAADLLGVDFVLNTVLNTRNETVGCFAGDLRASFEKATGLVDELYKVELDAPADIVVASPGGCPKDINLFQSLKTVDNASFAVKEGGVIVLLAECSEGVGNRAFYDLCSESESPRDMFDYSRENFEIGLQKTYYFVKTIQKAKVVVVSSLRPDVVEKMFMRPAKTLEEAMVFARSEVGREPSVLLLPHGGSVLPKPC